MNQVKRFIIGVTAGAVMLGSMAAPVFAGSLLRGEALFTTTPPPSVPDSPPLGKVCQSTTIHGDGITNEPGYLLTYSSEDCI